MRLKKLRKELDIPLRKLASYCGIIFTTLGKIENGNRDITDYHIKILSSFYNVSPKYLTGESNKYIKVMSDYDLNFYNITESEYEEYKNLDHVALTIEKRDIVGLLNGVPQQAPYCVTRMIIKESSKKIIERHINDFAEKIKKLTYEQRLEIIEYIETWFE